MGTTSGWAWITQRLWESWPRGSASRGPLVAAHHYWKERLTWSGKVMTAVVLFTVFIELIPGWSGGSILLGISALAFFIAWSTSLRISKWTLHWDVPSAVEEGDVITIVGHVQNTGKRTLRDVGAWSFRCGDGLEPSGDGVVVHRLGPGLSAQLQWNVKARLRGRELLRGPVRLQVEALGWMRARRFCEEPREVLVWPKTVALASCTFVTQGSSGREFARLLMPNLGRGMEFLGIREYRMGDSIRDVHHRAWARYGRPFTREFGLEKGAGAILLVRTGARGPVAVVCMERSLGVALGIAQWMVARGILGRFFVDDMEYPLGEVPLRTVREALARVPRTTWFARRAPGPWAPEARPMGPVLAVGAYGAPDPLVHKEIVLVPGSTHRTEECLWLSIADTLQGDLRL